MPEPAAKAAPMGAQQPFSFMNPWSMLSSVSSMGVLPVPLASAADMQTTC